MFVEFVDILSIQYWNDLKMQTKFEKYLTISFQWHWLEKAK